MNIFHKNDEQRIITGIALVATGPNGDRQSDVYDERAIESAVNSWSENGQRIYINHDRPAPHGSVSVLQAFQSPVGYKLNGSFVPQGSFVVVLKIHSDSLWHRIKSSGSEVGFSVGGSGKGKALGNGTTRISTMDIRELSILLDGNRPAVAEARVLQMKSEDKMDLNSPEVVALLKELGKVVNKLQLDQMERELTAALEKELEARRQTPKRYRTRVYDNYESLESAERARAARGQSRSEFIAECRNTELNNKGKQSDYGRI